MARNLARKLSLGGTSSSSSDSPENGEKELLNRREYLALGGVVATATLGVGSNIAGATTSSDYSTFTTDFSEYAL